MSNAYCVATAIAAVLVGGCMARGQAGHVRPTRAHDGHSGVALDIAINQFESPEENTSWGFGAAVRAKAGRELVQAALAPELIAATRLQRRVTPYLRSGLHLLQFESADDVLGFGMFSPYGELGVMVGVGKLINECDQLLGHISRRFVSVSVSVERNVRFSSVPDESYVMMQLGIGIREGAARCPQP